MTVITANTLQPLGMGQLLDRAIRLYRRNFLKFIGIVAIAQLPVILLTVGTSIFSVGSGELFDPTRDPTDISALFGPAVGATFLVGLLGVVLTQVATAALTRAVADNYLGQPVNMMEAYRKIGRSWVALVGALLLALLLYLLLVIWFLVPCIGWFTGGGMILYLFLVIIPLIAPVIVLEKQPAVKAIGRAWQLVRRRFWWVLGFMLLLTLFAQLLVAGPSFLIAALVQGAAGSAINTTVATIIQQLISSLFSLIYLPLQLTCITLLYFDIRVRTEGFDLALLAAGKSGGPEAVELAANTPETVQQPTKLVSLPTASEMGYFAVITIIGMALFIGFFLVLAFIGVLASGF